MNPSALVFLVDQSASMADPIGGTDSTRAAAVAHHLNGLLYELVQRCTKSLTEPPRPYFGVAAIGYHTDPEGNPVVKPMLGGPLADRDFVWSSELASHPLRLEEHEDLEDFTGGRRYKVPVWVEPTALGGTPVCEAVRHAGKLVRGWVEKFPDAFPPIVINLSDGESTDGDPIEWSQRLRQLKSNDGEALFFNLGIGSNVGQSVMFPSSLPANATDHDRVLFEMSSRLPPVMLDAARNHGYDVGPGARGFALDADIRSIVTFLNVGTAVDHLLR